MTLFIMILGLQLNRNIKFFRLFFDVFLNIFYVVRIIAECLRPGLAEKRYLKTIYNCHKCAGTLDGGDIDGIGEPIPKRGAAVQFWIPAFARTSFRWLRLRSPQVFDFGMELRLPRWFGDAHHRCARNEGKIKKPRGNSVHLGVFKNRY